MPLADFCLITLALLTKALLCSTTFIYPRGGGQRVGPTYESAVTLTASQQQAKQISPDKNVNFHYTAAPSTLPARSPSFGALGHLASRLDLIGCFGPSAHSFTSRFLPTRPHGVAVAIR